ncbi:hypothetical protein M3Y97_00965800 [Aphelenchoides bicaudatus]|nr:hypothetical protein M3Y97_00965800 [Aphelenchoides bicaudatus]
MACAKRFRPPFYPASIFFFCGLEFAWNAFVMAINQKFWDLSTKIFPTAFKIFNDTLAKGEPADFQWTSAEYAQLQMYQYKLASMWLCSTITILYAMLCIVPQFCTLEKSDGTEVTFCVKKPILGYIMAPFLILLIILCGSILTWQWFTCQNDYDLFQNLFNRSHKEESFLSELENQLNCESDDDKETSVLWKCDSLISRSVLNRSWLDPLIYSFIGCHLLMFVGFSFVNREWGSSNNSLIAVEEDETPKKPSIIETNGKPLEIQKLI